jgi:hypothetical protein
MTEGTKLETISPEKPEATSLQLDALKAIRESASQRWDKRRSYEWQLSISIWTAAAAFSAIVLNKDFPFDNKWIIAKVVFGVGFFIFGCHAFYLWKMMDHTIGDAELQIWVEKKIYKTVFHKELVDNNDEYAPQHSFYRKLSKYGIIQAIISLILVIAAVGAVLAPRHQSPQANAVSKSACQ